MKKLITLCALTALLVSSCDSSLRDLNGSKNTSQINQAETGIPAGATQAEADSIRKVAWQQFQAINGSNWQIRRSQKTGLTI